MSINRKTKQNVKSAYLFPGQGSQKAGMGKDLFYASPSAKAVFEEVDHALGRPLSKLIFDGDDTEITKTVNAQPAIMAVSLACFSAFEEGLSENDTQKPIYVAGHSLGEYTALVVSGVLEIGHAAQLVQERGRLMQQACDANPGTMAAILGLEVSDVEKITKATGTYISNINTPQQIVISGDKTSVSNALKLASSEGAKKSIQLHVAGAFHSNLMETAQPGLLEMIETLPFKNPTTPIISNCTSDPLYSAEEVKLELVDQITSCVQWNSSMNKMIDAGVSNFLEIGPGSALSSMTKRIDRSVRTTNISNMGDIETYRKYLND